MSNIVYFNNGNIAKLSNEQKYVLDNVNNFTNWTIIDATPGSGKTLTVCCLIAYLIEYLEIEKNNIIFLTYTRNASSQMKFKLKYFIDSFIELSGTIHSIAYQFIKNDNTNTDNDESNYFSPCEILANFLKHLNLIKNNKLQNNIISNLKYLIIDEYQDLDVKQLEIIELIQEISNCKVILFGDIDQSIYQFRNAINTLESSFFDKFKKYSLTYNFRNNENIIKLANNLLKYKYLNNDKTIKQGKLFKESEQLNKVKINGFNTLFDELQHIVDYIHTIDYFKKKVLILSRYRYPLALLENLFVKENINYNNLDDSKYIKNDKISITTIHGAKGLEADIVILLNAGNIDIQSENNNELFNNINSIEEINLLYVAITRAKTLLYITYHYQLNNILNCISLDIEHNKPKEIIKPIIYPKNNYISFGVTEIVKNLTLKDYENIKIKYKILSNRKKVHPSLKEITGNNFLNVISFLNTKISGTLPITGNFIDHYIGYIVGLSNNNFNYHPDLGIIKLVDYIGKDYNIYKLIYQLGTKINEFIDDINDINNVIIKYKNDFDILNLTTEKAINLCKNIKNIIIAGHKNSLINFIQSNPIKSNISIGLKKFLSFNQKLLEASSLDNDSYNILLKTIFVNSLISGYLQGKYSYEYLIIQIKKQMFNDKNELIWFKHIQKYIIDNNYDIYQKSLHGPNMINGIIDLYSSINKTIVDIKCSYSEFIPSQYVIQLLYYYNLARDIGLPISNNLKLYLPLSGLEISYTFIENEII
jgi:hypothetical protein